MTLTSIRSAIWAALSLLFLAPVHIAAAPATIHIVAIGASNTSGWGVLAEESYPARLQALLRAKGYNAQVANAGVLFDTTNGMLGRLNAAVPDGTRVVILQPGGNDLRFSGNKAQRSANIAAMVKRLHARNIRAIVFDPVIPPQYYQWDGIHLSSAGHAMFAAKLLPLVVHEIGR